MTHFQTHLKCYQDKHSDQVLWLSDWKCGLQSLHKVFLGYDLHCSDIVFDPTWPIFKILRNVIKTNILTKFYDYQTENVASRAYTRFFLRIWPSDLVFDPTWPIFKFSPRQTFWQVPWLLDWKCSCEKAASGLERILCRVLVKRTPGKHGLVYWPLWYDWNIVENDVKHHTIKNQSKQRPTAFQT